MKSPLIAFVIALVIALAIPFHAFSQLYIWTDKDGVKHVTNTAPPTEAENVQEQGEAENIPPTPSQKLQESIDRAKDRIKDHQAEIRDKLQKNKSEAEAKAAVSDYQISSISVTKEGEDRIRISGRISGGGPCKSLRVSISLSSNQGGYSTIVTAVDNVGGSASRIFEGSDWVGNTYANGTWKVVGTSFHCISN